MAKSFINRSDLPIGLRNNNPGNLRPGISWHGVIGTNGGFLVFESVAYGIRALATDVGNDIRLDGTNTIRKLISEFAPPSENDTAAYIRAVERSTGYLADQIIPQTQEALKRLLRAIINHENGSRYASLITDQDILQGMALVNENLKKYFKISVSVTIGGAVLLIGVIAWLLTRK